MPKFNSESIITTAVATAKPTRLGTFLRNKPVSGSITDDYSDLLDIFIDLDEDFLNIDELEDLQRIFDDIEFIGRVEMNEAIVTGPHIQTDDAVIGRENPDEFGHAIFFKDQPEKIYKKDLPKKGEPGGKPTLCSHEIADIEKLTNWQRLIKKLQKLLGEGFLRSKKCTSQKRDYSRKWYKKNRVRLAAKRKKLSAATDRKRKETMSRQRKNSFGKPMRKYPSSKSHSNEHTSFAQFVKPITEKKIKVLKKKFEKRYFMAEQSLQIGDYEFKKNDVFILEGQDLKFEKNNKRYTIKDIPSAVFQYLKEI